MNQRTIYKVFENKVVETNFEPSFFNSAQYVQFHSHKNFLSFGLFVNETATQSSIILNIFLDNNVAVSPYHAPFGSIECAKHTTEAEIAAFLNFVISHLKALQIIQITIVNFPACMHPNHANIIHKIMLQSNFSIIQCDTNQHIQITTQIFEKIICYEAKRRVRKLEKSGFDTFVNEYILPTQVYDFIKIARKRKNYPLNIDLETFRQSIATFPDKYLIFTCFFGQELAAVAIAVKVNSDTLYNYLTADNEKYLNFSPAISIVKSMYNYAQNNGFELLDMGISSYQSIINKGLYTFKKNLGAMDSSKIQYQLNLLL